MIIKDFWSFRGNVYTKVDIDNVIVTLFFNPSTPVGIPSRVRTYKKVHLSKNVLKYTSPI